MLQYFQFNNIRKNQDVEFTIERNVKREGYKLKLWQIEYKKQPTNMITGYTINTKFKILSLKFVNQKPGK